MLVGVIFILFLSLVLRQALAVSSADLAHSKAQLAQFLNANAWAADQLAELESTVCLIAGACPKCPVSQCNWSVGRLGDSLSSLAEGGVEREAEGSGTGGDNKDPNPLAGA